MSETFTKLFGSITDSTIWSEDNETRLVWITMLAMADQHGYVGASLPGLAHRARVSLEATERAIGKLLAPDTYSRSPEYDGRRIEADDRGWTILNYGRFRDMRDEEIRREYERKRKRAQRQKANVPDSPSMSHDVPQSPAVSAQAEAEAEAEADQDQGRVRARDAMEPVWSQRPKMAPLSASTHRRCDADGAVACARGICIPAFLIAQWRQQISPDDSPAASKTVQAFVGLTIAALPDGPIGDEPLAFWRAAWTATHGQQAPMTRRLTRAEESIAASARVIARLERKEP